MYDVIIIGCGPSGMTCALYCLRAGKKVLILEKSMYGGQIALTNNIENFPSIKNIDGVSLATNMFEQIKSMGAEIKFEEVVSCKLGGEIKIISTHKNSYEAKCVFIATGASSRPLGTTGEKQFINRGVSYCATCDGALYKNQNVAIVGGGNTALEDCLYLGAITNKVYLIHRRDEFRGDQILVDKVKQLEKLGKVELVLNSEVVKILGENKLQTIIVKNKKTGETTKLDVGALFVAIGRKPDTEIFEGIDTNDYGHIITNDKMQTNIQGVFAGGDVRNTNLRQIITACSDGAVASVSINEYLNKIKTM